MKKIGILGLGRVGRTLSAYLMGQDVEVMVFDQNPQAFLNRYIVTGIQTGKIKKIENFRDLKKADLVIKSPGIPNEADWIVELDASGVKMIDEIEFVWNQLDRPLTVAVTGTNGKSTTTGWIAEVLRTGGLKIFCGGNIAPGRPFSEALGDGKYDAYVIEVSTFQLERCPTFKPDVGVLLNITADHLNRHTMEEYVDLKLSLFKNHTPQDRAVLNFDDDLIKKHMENIKGKQLLFSLDKSSADSYLKDDCLYLHESRVINKGQLSIPGMHNVANALAAIAVAGDFKIGLPSLKTGLKKFKGLPHRMQYLGKIQDRSVYNNSMCTNPVAFYNSVTAFDEPSVIIAGGTEKGLSIDPFLEGVKERAKYLILFGQNARKLSEVVTSELHFSSCITVDSLRAALQAALRYSQPGDRILFAPGFASFGNFKNFEERGHAFIKEYRAVQAGI